MNIDKISLLNLMGVLTCAPLYASWVYSALKAYQEYLERGTYDCEDWSPYNTETGDTSGLGKSKYALPYLRQNGFKIIFDGYQVILSIG